MRAQKKYIVVALLTVCLQSAFADSNSPITPYRPSVSSPAQLPAPGQLEFEFGGQHTKTGSIWRDSLPYLFKLGFSEKWGVLLGGEAQVWQRDDTSAHGVGDTTVTLKRAFIRSDTTSFGLELAAKMPTAKNSIGSGKADYTLNSIYSQDFGKIHMDANLNATRIGAVDPGASRTQTGLSSAFSMPLSERWSGIAEVSGARRSGVSSTAQFLTALVYSPTKRLSIDVGLTKGLTSASQDWSIFSGFVVPLANFW